MTRELFASLLVLFLAPPKPPATPLPALPVLARLTIDATAGDDRALVVHDFVLDRGDYHGGDLALYVAYGAPGMPAALDAQIFPGGASLPPLAATGDVAPVEARARKPEGIDWSVGRGSQAGAWVRLPGASMVKAWNGGATPAIVRIRAVHAVTRDEHGERDLVVRLGTALGQPVALSRVDVRGSARAHASTCRRGDAIERVTLYDADTGKRLDLADWRDPAVYYARVAPSLLQRSADEDLCVTF